MDRHIKWPRSMLYFRHLPSAYNINRNRWKDDAEWREFTRLYKRDFQGERTVELAKILQARYEFAHGDAQTPVDETTVHHATLMAQRLREAGTELPDLVFVSPYLRTQRTWQGMVAGWPKLKRVTTIREERIREQEHGLSTLYINWRVFHVLNPLQRLLYERNGPYYYRYPQGESVPDVRERHRSWITTIIRDHYGKRVWAVGHHLGVLSLMAHLERWDDKKFNHYDTKLKPINCGVTRYDCDPEQGENGRLLRTYYNRNFHDSL